MEEPLVGESPSLPNTNGCSTAVADRKERVRVTGQRKGGTLLELLEWVVSTGEEDMMWSYLSTYRIFAPPLQLLKMWMGMYTTYAADSDDYSREFNHRMVLFMRYWVDHFFDQDFKDKPAFYELVDFINKNLPREEANKLKLAFVKKPSALAAPHPPDVQNESGAGSGHPRKSSGIKSIPMLSIGAPAKPRGPLSPSGFRSPTPRSAAGPSGPQRTVYIEDLSPSEIAINLTAIEFACFEKVRPEELFHMNWQKPERETLAPNISSLTQRFNQVSFWVATEVVTAPTPKQRVDILKKFIKSAQKLRALNNFNSVMEVVAGLNNSSVQRLKGLWNMLPSQYLARFDDLDKLMNPTQNFKLYREEVRQVDFPAIPYFAPTLRDVTFIYDGNREYISPGKINFEIMDLLGCQVRELLRYQRVPYNLLTDYNVLNYLKSVRPMDEDILRKFSFKAEPAGPTSLAKEPRLREGPLSSPLSKSDSDFSLFNSSEEFDPAAGDASTPRDELYRQVERLAAGRGEPPTGGGGRRYFSLYLTPDTSGPYAALNSPRSRKSAELVRESEQITPRMRSKSVAAGESEIAGSLTARARAESQSQSQSTPRQVKVVPKLPPNHGRVVANIYKLPRPKASPKPAPLSPRMPIVLTNSRGKGGKHWLPRWGSGGASGGGGASGSLDFENPQRRASDSWDEDDYTEDDDTITTCSSKPGESDSESLEDDDETQSYDDDDELSQRTEGGLSAADLSEVGSDCISVRSDGDEATEEAFDDDDFAATTDDFALTAAIDDDAVGGASAGSPAGSSISDPGAATHSSAKAPAKKGKRSSGSVDRKRSHKEEKQPKKEKKREKKHREKEKEKRKEEKERRKRDVATSIGHHHAPPSKQRSSSKAERDGKPAITRKRSSLRLSTTYGKVFAAMEAGLDTIEQHAATASGPHADSSMTSSLSSSSSSTAGSSMMASSSGSGVRPRRGTGCYIAPPSSLANLRDDNGGAAGPAQPTAGGAPFGGSSGIVAAAVADHEAKSTKLDVHPRRAAKVDTIHNNNNHVGSGGGSTVRAPLPSGSAIHASSSSAVPTEASDAGVGPPVAGESGHQPGGGGGGTVRKHKDLTQQLHQELREKGERKEQAKVKEFKHSLHRELEERRESEKKLRARQIRERLHSELRELAGGGMTDSDDGSAVAHHHKGGSKVSSSSSSPQPAPKAREGADASTPSSTTSAKDQSSSLPRWRRPFFTAQSRSASFSSSSSITPLTSPSAPLSSSSSSCSTISPSSSSSSTSSFSSSSSSSPPPPARRGSGSLAMKSFFRHASDLGGSGDGATTTSQQSGAAGGGSGRVKAHARKRSVGQGSLFWRELLHREIRSTAPSASPADGSAEPQQTSAGSTSHS